MTPPAQQKLSFSEVLGVRPLGTRFRQALVALRGQEDVPPARYDLSSLWMLRPRVAWPLWRGRDFVERQVLVTTLFNHRQTPIEQGWSVKRTQVEDFRGRDLTYDSHNGTDFSIPVGSTVLTAAPGEVVRVVSEFNRGGLKVFIDHGQGLMTCTAHLARSLVTEGDLLERGQPIAISGYSGLDGFVTFPFGGVPHIHFNTWLNGEPVDPFPRGEHTSLWRAGNLPRPPEHTPLPEPAVFTPSVYAPDAVDRAIAHCKTSSSRERLRSITALSRRAAHTVADMNYYPTRYPSRGCLYAEQHPRAPLLDLPFSGNRFDGVVFVDEL